MKALYRSKVRIFWAFIIPMFALFFTFTVIPFIKTFYYSLTDWNGMSVDANFVGLKNFKEILLESDQFLNAFKNNLIFLFVGGALVFAISLFNAAWISQGKLKEGKIYRIIFFIPNVISGIITSILWKFIYTPNFGLLNTFLRSIGLDEYALNWLGNKSTVVYAIIVVSVWGNFGYYTLLFCAAIEGIPSSFLEAADIDGASDWQKFFHITLPLIRDMIRTALVFYIINAISGIFSLVKVMTNGGPSEASQVITNLMYQTAFFKGDFGKAAAMGIVIFLIIAIFAFVFLRLTKPKDSLEY